MALIRYYKNISKEEYLPILKRVQSDDEAVKSAVLNIMENVRINGDKAIYEYEKAFDHSELTSLFVSEAEGIRHRCHLGRI